jgi:hypothetical protein
MVIWECENNLGDPRLLVPPSQVGGGRTRDPSAPVGHRSCPGEIEDRVPGKALDETSGKAQTSPQGTKAGRKARGAGFRAD